MILKLDLENCHGIKTLHNTFTFNNSPLIIHAPNGTFKTSLCRTIKDIKNGIDSLDNVSGVVGTRSILIDGNPINPDDVVVFDTDSENYDGIAEKSKTLLLNKSLRKRLENAEAPYLDACDKLFQSIKKEGKFASKKQTDLIDIIQALFSLNSKDAIIDYFHRNSKRVHLLPFSIESYSSYFGSSVKKIMDTDEAKINVRRYVRIYNSVSKKAKFLKNGTFELNDLFATAEELKSRKYFEPGNKIKLFGEKTINSCSELDLFISKLNSKISNDEEIREGFKNLQESLRSKRGGDIVLRNINSVPQSSKFYSNYDLFEKKYFSNLFFKHFSELDAAFLAKKRYYSELEKIKKLAKKDITIWNNVVDEFNSRFQNRYSLYLTNKEEAVLGTDCDVGLEFVYKYDAHSYNLPIKNTCEGILSEGERRTFLLLDMLFEIENYKLSGKKRLLIFDDIADSLDYTNKHCIIQYLKDIAEVHIFDVLVLTHNFDFYRHFGRRVSNNGAYFACSDGNGNISIDSGADYLYNIYSKLKNNAKQDANAFNASLSLIPFLRAAIEISDKSLHQSEFDALTKMLHYRSNGGSNYTGNKLNEIFKKVLKIESLSMKRNSNRIYKLLYNQAKIIASSTSIKQNIEEKIVIAMALRIYGEKYMQNVLKRSGRMPPNFDYNIEFGKLYCDYFKPLFGGSKQKEAKTLDVINILTPIEIHVNGFAYEPFVDYSIPRLRTLFVELDSLLPSRLKP